MTSTTEVTSPSEMQSTREVERKYEAADEVSLPDPSRLLGAQNIGENIGAAEDQQLDAVYFDTPDLRLLRAGVTLRRREGGADPGWHLKLPVGKDSREELRVPLGQAQRTPPAELTALTRVHTRGAEVAPVVRLRTRRRRWQLADDDGRPLAELVEDRVTAHTLGSDTSDTSDTTDTSDTGDTGAVSWREVEVELSEHGSVALLDQVEQRLLDAGARRSGAASKLSRVLADRLRALPTGPSPMPTGRSPTRATRPARPCSRTCVSRPAGCADSIRWSAGTPPTRCTRCGWRAGGCAAPCRPTGGCWTATPPGR